MRYLLVLILCVGCSHHTMKEPERLTINNPTHMVFRCKKAFTVDTETAGPITFFTLDTQNVPALRKFYLQGTDEVIPSGIPAELASDADGILRYAADTNLSLAKCPFPIQFFLPGEICNMWLVSDDKQIVVKTSFIPYPLVTYASDGAEAEVIRLERDGSVVRCQGAYFNDNEALIVRCSANKGKHKIQRICHNGTFVIDLPSPDPESFGEMIMLTVTRESGETLTLSYPVGREVFNKDHLCANVSKLTEEEYDQVNDAYECYFKGSSPDQIT